MKLTVSIGSNCGDRHKAVEDAIHWLELQLQDCHASSVYETDPVGKSAGKYLNAVVTGSTALDAGHFDALCKAYEREAGRDEEARRNNLVPVDIDIVVADGIVLRPRDYGCWFFRKGMRQLQMQGNA